MAESGSFDPAVLIESLPRTPGVYLMQNRGQEVIYVGKAKDLKKRVSSYFQKTHSSLKTQHLVNQINHVDVVLTETETEALLLEINLIKQHQPRYNVCFRDDKSYPYLYLSSKDKFPRLVLHRGPKRRAGEYFGPYPSATAAKETLYLLQKIFKLRTCEDAFFANRTRPCLQYQIERCSAPCVNYIEPANYQRDIKSAQLFLQGKNYEIVDELGKQMELAAQAHRYEEAAVLRDQIAALRHIQQPQSIAYDGAVHCDVIAILKEADIVSAGMLLIREGQVMGTQHYFLQVDSSLTMDDIWYEFLPQYYLNPQQPRSITPEIIIDTDFTNRTLLADALTTAAKHKVIIKTAVRGIRAKWQTMAIQNAKDAIKRQRLTRANLQQRFVALAQALARSELPKRIECFDVSHSSGEAPQASCVVFTQNGALKSDYRRFNITGITDGDDYAALEQALQRRYSKQQAIEKIPDILLIDGGKGQLHIALKVLAACELPEVLIVGVAKGRTRKPGFETLFIHDDDTPVHLPEDSIALHLIQQIRDEAHRFAITGHRQRRKKARQQSPLDSIPGIGAKRRKLLIIRFGGWQGVKAASVSELMSVPGISSHLAELIYSQLREAN